MRILLAEDEKPLARAVALILEKNHYSVDTVFDGEDALDWLEDGTYDAAVLDIMMPKMDGLTVLRRLREQGSSLPVLLLTAKSEIDDKVAGLDSGADDYLTKPFDSRELLARIRAMTRTAAPAPDTRIVFGNLSLDRATFELATPSGSYKLAGKEYQMMEMFLSNPRHILSQERFMEKIWGFDTEVDSSIVWVYISYLRKKLTALKADCYIKATRGAGYSLEENP